MMDKVHFYMCLHIASSKSTAGNKTWLFLSPFLISINSFLILAEAFGSDHVAACSTALRSATEKNEMGGYVTIPCLSKMTRCSRTAIGSKSGVTSADCLRLNTYGTKIHF